jgi:hypothetical protein
MSRLTVSGDGGSAGTLGRSGSIARRDAFFLERGATLDGKDEPRLRFLSPSEQLLRRLHHEGLPLARLWESREALVSLGLNQRGKLGVWLIQKTH